MKGRPWPGLLARRPGRPVSRYLRGRSPAPESPWVSTPTFGVRATPGATTLTRTGASSAASDRPAEMIAPLMADPSSRPVPLGSGGAAGEGDGTGGPESGQVPGHMPLTCASAFLDAVSRPPILSTGYVSPGRWSAGGSTPSSSRTPSGTISPAVATSAGTSRPASRHRAAIPRCWPARSLTPPGISASRSPPRFSRSTRSTSPGASRPLITPATDGSRGTSSPTTLMGRLAPGGRRTTVRPGQ